MKGGRHPGRLEALVASLLLVLAACAAGTAVGMTVPFSTLAKGNRSGIREPTQTIVRSSSDWDAIWVRHTRTQTGPPPSPAVDFSREMIAALFMGERSTGGYEIEITRVERAGSGLAVHYRSRGPAPGAMVTTALTQPFHVIKLPRDDGPVVFVAESSS